MDVKKTFIGGRMNLDDDERLISETEYRRAENINVINSEGSDVGAIENAYSNKKLTNITLGANPKTITPNLCINKVRNKIYWMVKSDTGCFLIEYNANNNFNTIVLQDTRPLNTRVFNLNENYLITGIEILIGETEEEDLMLWTDDNMDPCCINIERAKGYGENGFAKEDIYLIKKPPTRAPRTIQINSSEQSNYLEEKFLLFATRYQYLDGEYSALSSFSYYKFTPKSLQLDFLTGENLGMVNNFNSVKIFFNTGEKQVVKVDVIAKGSNSNTLYKIESFNKELEGWADNEERSISFNNNKKYTILSETETIRYFDKVPLKAKALTLIENRPVFGNYVEGFNIKDQFNNKIRIDLITSYNSYSVEGEVLNINFPSPNFVTFFNTTATINPVLIQQGTSIIININISSTSFTSNYIGEFIFIAPEDFQTFNDLGQNNDFITLIETIISNDFQSNLQVTNLPDGFSVDGLSNGFEIIQSTNQSITIKTPVVIIQTTSNPIFLAYAYNESGTSFLYKESSNITTLKSNRDYEVGIVYKDEFQRATTVLNSKNNSTFIPIENSITQNKLQVRINNLPPAFAKTYKLVVKAQPLSYQIIYVNQFFEDGSFRWIKLEGENKDKVKEGSVLILKTDRLGPTSSVIKIKVLEAGVQDSDFILDNVDEFGTEIVEPKGFYAKISPIGFSMNYEPDEFLVSESNTKLYTGQPISYADLFSIEDENNPGQFINREIIPGSIITFYFKSKRRNQEDQIFEKNYTVQTAYDGFEEWFAENIVGTSLIADNGDEYDDVSVVRGQVQRFNQSGTTFYVFTANANGRLYLKVRGIYGGNDSNRRGFLDVKVTLRNVTGIFSFETETRNAEQEFYYESEETFEIINGAHQGNIQNQDEPSPAQENISDPAIVELDFFNAYCFGNGLESYQIKDSQLKDYLNIDLKPSIVQVDEYKQIRRFADKCFGGTYNEGFNAINEFLIQNIKQLDKQYGSIQKLFSRNTNVLVFQEFKTSYVLYAKNTISTATGTDVITRDSQILGEQVPYAGENGVGTKPESVANDDFRFYFANPVRGSVIRLSMDGTENINIKLVDWFKDMFQTNPFGAVIGGFDTHHKQYAIHFKQGTTPGIVPTFDVPISFFETDEATYYMPFTDVFDEAYIDYVVSEGTIDIVVGYDRVSESYLGLTGTGTITVTTGKVGTLTVSATSDDPASFSFENRRSESPTLKLKLLTLGDEYVAGKSIINQHGSSGKTFNNNILFDSIPSIYYSELEGKEGEGQIPINGRDIQLSSYKSNTNNLDYNEDFLIGYLITETEYKTTNEDIEEIIENATFLSLTTTQLTKETFIKSGVFNFSRANNNQILYLIWDYRKTEPEIIDPI